MDKVSVDKVIENGVCCVRSTISDREVFLYHSLGPTILPCQVVSSKG